MSWPSACVSARPRSGEEFLVSVTGEFDRATLGHISRVLADLPACTRVLLDLRGVTFLDMGALRLILETADALKARGIGFKVVEGPAPVMRTLLLAGAGSRLAFAKPSMTVE